MGDQLGFYRIADLSSAVALSSLSGAAALRADGVAIQAEGGNVRWRADGTTANATTGALIVADDPPQVIATGLLNATRLADITLIEADAGATANVLFLRMPKVSKEF
jgi:hypothetical protein